MYSLVEQNIVNYLPIVIFLCIACALATGLGVTITALVLLFGAAIIFYKIPFIHNGFTVIGGLLLIYFAKRYIQKALSSHEKLIALQDIDFKPAF